MSNIRRSMMAASRGGGKPSYCALDVAYGIQIPYKPNENTEILIWVYWPTFQGSNFRVPFTEDAGRTPYNYMSSINAGGRFMYNTIFQNNGWMPRYINRVRTVATDCATAAGTHALFRFTRNTITRKQFLNDVDEECNFNWDDIAPRVFTFTEPSASDWEAVRENVSGTFWFFPDAATEHLYSIKITENGADVYNLVPNGGGMLNTVTGITYAPKYVEADQTKNLLPTT